MPRTIKVGGLPSPNVTMKQVDGGSDGVTKATEEVVDKEIKTPEEPDQPTLPVDDPVKEQETEEETTVTDAKSDEKPETKPKRRGRPPKNQNK